MPDKSCHAQQPDRFAGRAAQSRGSNLTSPKNRVGRNQAAERDTATREADSRGPIRTNEK